MWKYIFLCILFGHILIQSQELKLPVNPYTQERLSEALQKLSDELENFRTFYENKVNLYRRIIMVEEYLQKVRDQVSQYDNVLIGEHNTVQGSKNIILGSFNTITGSNNYVFIQKYNGRANGDLLLGKWRIDIERKNLVLIHPSSAISFINQEFNRKYLRYLAMNNGGFGYGTNVGQNVVILMRDNQSGDLFDSGKRVSYKQTGIEYRVNNQFQYGVSSVISSSDNMNKIDIDHISQLNTPNPTFVQDQQQKLIQPLGLNQPQLGHINPVFIANIPLPPTLTYIEPNVLTAKSIQFLNQLQQAIFSSTLATRYVPQPDSVVLPSIPQTNNENSVNQNILSPSKQQSPKVNKNDEGYRNHVFDTNPFNSNFKTNLRSQILSNNPQPQKYQNPINFEKNAFLTIPFYQNIRSAIEATQNSNQQNPQINLSEQKP